MADNADDVNDGTAGTLTDDAQVPEKATGEQNDTGNDANNTTEDGTVSGALGDGVEDLGDGVANGVQDIGEGVGDAVKDVGDAVGNAADGR